MSDLSWSFFNICNLAAEKPDRPMLKRSHIWASELAIAPVDVILRMRGTTPTNPPNARSMRKFHAGNVWESYMYLVLYAAGILKSDQTHLSHQYPGLLEVTGKLDFVAGGTPDWERARALVGQVEYLEPIRYFIDNMIDGFERAYGNNTLKEIIVECKSVSSFMFPRYQKLGKPSLSHAVQCFHYEKSTGRDEGHVVYINKDDSMMLEFGIYNPSDIEIEYKSRIENLTKFYTSDELPPIEQEILFDDETGRFSTNWRVEYSNYLSMLYGYDQPDDYRSKWTPVVSSYNRTLGRIVRGEKVTAKNAEAIESMQKQFGNFDQIIDTAKSLAKQGLGLDEPEVVL